MTKSSFGRKGVIWLILPGHSQSSREVRTEPRQNHAVYELPRWLMLSSLFYADLARLCKDGVTHSGLVLPKSIISQGGIIHTYLKASLVKADH